MAWSAFTPESKLTRKVCASVPPVAMSRILAPSKSRRRMDGVMVFPSKGAVVTIALEARTQARAKGAERACHAQGNAPLVRNSLLASRPLVQFRSHLHHIEDVMGGVVLDPGQVTGAFHGGRQGDEGFPGDPAV